MQTPIRHPIFKHRWIFAGSNPREQSWVVIKARPLAVPPLGCHGLPIVLIITWHCYDFREMFMDWQEGKRAVFAQVAADIRTAMPQRTDLVFYVKPARVRTDQTRAIDV